MARELLLVRHGASEHHARGLTGGWTDASLTAQGRLQAQFTGKALIPLCASGNTRFLSSDLLRARETAEIIAEHIGIRPEFRAELRELNNGAAKDKTLEEAESLALPVTEPILDWAPYPGAESWRAMSERVMAFLSTVAEETEQDCILVVSHGNAMEAATHWWLRLEERHWSGISYEFGCGSITRLSTNEWGGRVISKLNDTAHLTGTPRSWNKAAQQPQGDTKDRKGTKH